MIVEGLGENFESTFAVRILQRLYLREKIRMTAERPLRERDQRARQDVGTFYRDADRPHLIGSLDVVGGPVADAPAAMNVERVVDASAHALGRDIFQERRDDRRLLAGRDH